MHVITQASKEPNQSLDGNGIHAIVADCTCVRRRRVCEWLLADTCTHVRPATQSLTVMCGVRERMCTHVADLTSQSEVASLTCRVCEWSLATRCAHVRPRDATSDCDVETEQDYAHVRTIYIDTATPAITHKRRPSSWNDLPD